MLTLLSPVIANLFMEEFEEKALATATLKPDLQFKNVDHKNEWLSNKIHRQCSLLSVYHIWTTSYKIERIFKEVGTQVYHSS